jgi:hypothetical protein
MNSCFQNSCWLQTLIHLSAQLFDNAKVSLKFFFCYRMMSDFGCFSIVLDSQILVLRR